MKTYDILSLKNDGKIPIFFSHLLLLLLFYQLTKIHPLIKWKMKKKGGGGEKAYE
jgi:hypothetical protein